MRLQPITDDHIVIKPLQNEYSKTQRQIGRLETRLTSIEANMKNIEDETIRCQTEIDDSNALIHALQPDDPADSNPLLDAILNLASDAAVKRLADYLDMRLGSARRHKNALKEQTLSNESSMRETSQDLAKNRLKLKTLTPPQTSTFTLTALKALFYANKNIEQRSIRLGKINSNPAISWIFTGLRCTPSRNPHQWINGAGNVSFLLPRVKVTIDMTNGSVLFNRPRNSGLQKSFTAYARNTVHPHIIDSSGAPCLGDFRVPLAEAVKACDLELIVSVLTLFLTSAQTDDPAGCLWPMFMVAMTNAPMNMLTVKDRCYSPHHMIRTTYGAPINFSVNNDTGEISWRAQSQETWIRTTRLIAKLRDRNQDRSARRHRSDHPFFEHDDSLRLSNYVMPRVLAELMRDWMPTLRKIMSLDTGQTPLNPGPRHILDQLTSMPMPFVKDIPLNAALDDANIFDLYCDFLNHAPIDWIAPSYKPLPSSLYASPPLRTSDAVKHTFMNRTFNRLFPPQSSYRIILRHARTHPVHTFLYHMAYFMAYYLRNRASTPDETTTVSEHVASSPSTPAPSPRIIGTVNSVADLNRYLRPPPPAEENASILDCEWPQLEENQHD